MLSCLVDNVVAAPPPPYRASTAVADDAVRVVMEAIDALQIGDRLLALRSVAGLVGSRRAGTVLAARSRGMSWGEIADRLGTSRQAVWKRFSPEEGDTTIPYGVARQASIGSRRVPARHALRTYSSCASYKAVTTLPRLEVAP
jgi:predicted DNA-binding transcriptional regulator AlpA